MKLLVDTYNVLHVVGVLPPELAGIDVIDLTQLIQASRYAADAVELICDGAPPAEIAKHPLSHGRVRIRYTAGITNDADTLIAALIAKSTAPRQLTVVTSDQWIIRQAKRRRCKTLSSEQFLHQIAADVAQGTSTTPKAKRPRDSISSRDANKWLRIFKLTPDELNSLTASTLPEVPIDDAPTPPPPAAMDPPMPLHDDGPLPADVIAEAERIWSQYTND